MHYYNNYDDYDDGYFVQQRLRSSLPPLCCPSFGHAGPMAKDHNRRF